ncbi:MAG: hypothetical protein JO287_05840 [Pseudonocardiales bacterium]|nr:hypothetical protein [Pseudonocardiales bacterium]
MSFLLQVAALLLVPVLAATTNSPVPPSVLGVLGWLGLVVGVITAFCAILLGRPYPDLRLLYVVPLWVIYSAILSLVVVVALWQEIRGSEARWNKLARTGVVSRDGLHRPVEMCPSLLLPVRIDRGFCSSSCGHRTRSTQGALRRRARLA